MLFQSTHSLRSATDCCVAAQRHSEFQSTHSLRSATRFREGIGVILEFQSTHSLRSATGWLVKFSAQFEVSIHALLAECDVTAALQRNGIPSFNPRTPCGVRPCDVGLVKQDDGFNPRTPCGVRQVQLPGPGTLYKVSIHALLAECDPVAPRPGFFRLVSIHALLAECDWALKVIPQRLKMFQSTHSLRSATVLASVGGVPPPGFNPRTPCGVRPMDNGDIKDTDQFQSTHSLRSAT